MENLRGWCLAQRHKRKKGLRLTEHIQLLNKIDFPWEGKRKKRWAAMYRELSRPTTGGTATLGSAKKTIQIDTNEEDNPDRYERMTTKRKWYHGMVKFETLQ